MIYSSKRDKVQILFSKNKTVIVTKNYNSLTYPSLNSRTMCQDEVVYSYRKEVRQCCCIPNRIARRT